MELFNSKKFKKSIETLLKICQKYFRIALHSFTSSGKIRMFTIWNIHFVLHKSSWKFLKHWKESEGPLFIFFPLAPSCWQKCYFVSLCVKKSSLRMGSVARVCSPTQHNLFGKGCEHVLRVAPPRTRPSADSALTRLRGDPERASARDAPPLPPVRCTSSFVSLSPPARWRWSSRLIKVNRRTSEIGKKYMFRAPREQRRADENLMRLLQRGNLSMLAWLTWCARAHLISLRNSRASKGRTRKLARRGPVTLQFDSGIS